MVEVLKTEGKGCGRAAGRKVLIERSSWTALYHVTAELRTLAETASQSDAAAVGQVHRAAVPTSWQLRMCDLLQLPAGPSALRIYPETCFVLAG